MLAVGPEVDDGEGLPEDRGEGEREAVDVEIPVVVEADGVADVGAVVVEGHDALAAAPAVLGALRPQDVAAVAERDAAPLVALGARDEPGGEKGFPTF